MDSKTKRIFLTGNRGGQTDEEIVFHSNRSTTWAGYVAERNVVPAEFMDNRPLNQPLIDNRLWQTK